ncbi:DUF4190 domain-containing protein [Catellatospora citrea]|uniref:DUF4190 domain-containing protein n=1 Tax=Catellatospora citrea TaxID=53366 RepID=UPI003400C589
MTYPPPSGQDPYSGQPDPYAPPAAANPYATPPSYGSPAVPGSPATPPASVPPVAPQSGQPYADPYKSADPYAAPQQPYGQAPYGQQPYGGYPPPRQQNSMALVALILSLVGLLTWITAPIGAILGHSAMKQIRQTGEDGEGMAKAAIIVGWILTGIGVVGCLCAFGLPFLAVLGMGGASTY